MRFYRSERVQSLIHDQLGQIITRELEFDGAFVTIMGVDVDKKLEFAKVRVSVIPAEKTVAALKELARNAGRLQHMLLRKINIKPMPRIAFEADHGPENAAQVEKVFLEHGKEIE
ncbi:MAG: ribosome-binding factor A [Candidatus Pacebacteria bacterium]|nr:ribosome-binding factor A [Candidatus Paceibacterota bacterium]